MVAEAAAPARRFPTAAPDGLLAAALLAFLATAGFFDVNIMAALVPGLGGLGVMVLPRLVPLYGHGVLFATLVAFSLCALGVLPFLDSYPAGRIVRPAASGGIRKGLLGSTAVALFLFQAGNMALLVYMIPLARHFGLTTGYASTVLGVSTWIGIAGCLAVVVFGTRFGRAWPLAIATAITAVACYAFVWSGVGSVFLLANCVSGMMWSFVGAYLLGMCAEFDQAGRTAALGGFVSKIGLATGPFVAAALSLPFMFVPALKLDRSRAT